MIIDMHVHTAEGSLDSNISIFDTVNKLKSLGYNGLLVTDHNSYKGYNAWVASGRNDFIVLRGIEYDTMDCGHVIIVLPSGCDTNIFKYRGMSLRGVIVLVHKLGGVVGQAHPFGYGKLSISDAGKDLIGKLDFIECFNACVSKEANNRARDLCLLYNQLGLAGTDSHRLNAVGLGRTIFNRNILTEDDLILAIKQRDIVGIQGKENNHSVNKDSKLYRVGVSCFYYGHIIMSHILAYKRGRYIKEIIDRGVGIDG